MRHRLLLLVVGLLGLSLIMSPGAQAASIYDTTYKSTATLVQKGSYGCSDQDITYNWSNYLTNDEFSGVKESFALAKSQGRWGVSVSYGSVNVFWTEDTSLYLDWMDPVYGGGYSVMAKGNAVHRAQFLLSGYYSPKPCIPYISSYSTDAGADAVIADRFGYNKNLFVLTDYPNYPSGYEGAPLVTSEPKAKHVAGGDSFSGGEGNPSFEAGTDVDGQNECHRSPQAYPRLLQNERGLGSTAFVACGGATLSNILGGQWNEPSQLSVLSEETEDVTLTAGGNDVGFKWYILGCTVECGPGTSVYSAMISGINDPAFKSSLINTYEAILEAAPTADLYVADYPYLAAEDATTCQGLDFSGAYDVQEALNAVIGAAVAEVALSSNRIFMVRTNSSGSPFAGKHLCNGSDSYFNGLVSWPNAEYSLHPNEEGHEAYADIFEEAMS